MGTIRALFVGDIQIEKTTDDPFLDSVLAKEFSLCDVCCCNLEGPCVVETSWHPEKKVGPSVKQGKNVASTLRSSGFNMVSLANNHIMDYGRDALLHTIKEFGDFHRIGIYNPELHSNYVIIEKAGISVSFLAAGENAFGCIQNSKTGFNYLLDVEFFQQIRELKRRTDYVIVNAHIGAEGLQTPFPEVRELYYRMVEEGADCIIGHHPHVVQGYEDYRGSRIYYSLGNFRMDDYEVETEMERYGAIAILEIDKEKIQYAQMTTYSSDGQVSVCENDRFPGLNECLIDMETVNQWCTEMYASTFREEYYRGGLLEVWDQNIFARLKTIIKLVFRRLRFSDAFLFHNVCVDTNLWLTRRALNNLSKNNE